MQSKQSFDSKRVAKPEFGNESGPQDDWIPVVLNSRGMINISIA
jgi:hypothetical protein